MMWLLVLCMLFNVPFISQESVGWYKNNDCGPATAEMLYRYYTDDEHNVSELYTDLMPGDVDAGMSGFELRQWLRAQGLNAEYYSEVDMMWLRRQRAPVIVEVDYAVLREHADLTGDTWGLHFVVVVGFVGGTVVIHDPLMGEFVLVDPWWFEVAWSLPASWTGYNAVVVEG